MREFTKSDFKLYQCDAGYKLLFDGKTLAIGSLECCQLELDNAWEEYCEAQNEYFGSIDYENRFY
jgi:hypothetical protein